MCEELRAAVLDNTVAIIYNRPQRAYFIPVVDIDDSPLMQKHGLTFRGGVSQLISFCPWTGRQFPGDLSDAWSDCIERELGKDAYQLFDPYEKLPTEFQTEEWWIKRGYGNVTTPPVYEDHAEAAREDGVEYVVYAIDPDPGYVRSSERPPHLCHASQSGIFGDSRVMYWYLPQVREYGFRLIDIHQPVNDQPIRIKPVLYCPCCGARLPQTLRDEWETRLTAMGLSPDSENIPARLLSDTWWKDAGL